MAHPVIWKGGRVLTTNFSPELSQVKAHISLSNRQSFGVHAIQVKKDQWVMLQSNRLFKRWNGDGVQSNIYGVFGLGVHYSNHHQPTMLHLGGQFDWETRRYLFMTSYHNQ